MLGRNVWNIIFVIGITSWPSTARLVRSQVLTVKERLYVDRARALGASRGQVIARHVLPNVSPLILASATLAVPISILTETTLAFLGLGDPTQASWGKTLEEAFGAGAISQGRVVVLPARRHRHRHRRAGVHAVRASARRDPRPTAA